MFLRWVTSFLLLGLASGCMKPFAAARTETPLVQLAKPQPIRIHGGVGPDGPHDPAVVQAAATSDPRVGQLAPEIAGEDLDGVPFRLSDYRGKVVLLDFWGHW